MPVSLPPVRPDPGCSPFTAHGCRLVPEYFANSRATVELLHPVVEKPDGRQKMFWSLMRSRLKRTVVTLAFAITAYFSSRAPTGIGGERFAGAYLFFNAIFRLVRCEAIRFLKVVLRLESEILSLLSRSFDLLRRTLRPANWPSVRLSILFGSLGVADHLTLTIELPDYHFAVW
jgi:hypothetical protein